MKTRPYYVSNSSSSSFLINDENKFNEVLNIAENIFKKFVVSNDHKYYPETTAFSLMEAFNKKIMNKNDILKYLKIDIYDDWYDYMEAQMAIKTFEFNKSGCLYCHYFEDEKCKFTCDCCKKNKECEEHCNNAYKECCCYGCIYDEMIKAKETLKNIKFVGFFVSMFKEYFELMYRRGYMMDDGHRIMTFKYKDEVFQSKEYQEFGKKLDFYVEESSKKRYKDTMKMIEMTSDCGDGNQAAIRGCGLLDDICKECKKNGIDGYLIENS